MAKRAKTKQIERDIRESLAKRGSLALLRTARADPSEAEPARDLLLQLGYKPKRIERALSPDKPAPSGSWQGTEANERAIYSVHNGLVSIYLDGVRGVSPERQGHEGKLLSPEEADRILTKARAVYVKLAVQKPPRSVKGWHASKIRELDSLIGKAAAVREGRAEQKMTVADYAALRQR